MITLHFSDYDLIYRMWDTRDPSKRLRYPSADLIEMGGSEFRRVLTLDARYLCIRHDTLRAIRTMFAQARFDLGLIVEFDAFVDYTRSTVHPWPPVRV